MEEFITLQKVRDSLADAPDAENSWSIDVQTQLIPSQQYDLSAKNPNKKEEVALQQPQAILEEMKALDEESADILSSILALI